MKTTPDSIVARLLGQTDALFSPHRFHQSEWLPRNTTLMRREYFDEGGIRWRSGVTSEADRKAASRALAEAGNQGLIQKINHRNSKSPAVKLTPWGEEIARDRFTLYTCEECFEFVQRLEDLWLNSPEAFVVSFSSEKLKPVWVLENTLVGLEHNQPTEDKFDLELLRAELRMAPAVKAGWVETAGNTRGNVFYRVTPKWLEEKPVSYPRIHENLRIFDEELCGLYFESYREQRAYMASVDPTDPKEIGFIPISCSIPQRKDI